MAFLILCLSVLNTVWFEHIPYARCCSMVLLLLDRVLILQVWADAKRFLRANCSLNYRSCWIFEDSFWVFWESFNWKLIWIISAWFFFLRYSVCLWHLVVSLSFSFQKFCIEKGSWSIYHLTCDQKTLMLRILEKSSCIFCL